jgi:hypothetical protein
MFKALVIPFLALFGAHVQQEIKLDLFHGDDRVGSGTFKESTDKHGHRTRVIALYARDDAETKVKIVNTKVVDGNAFPIMEEEEFTQESGSIRSTIVWKVRYDRNGAAVLSESKDRKRYPDRTFAPIPGYSRADASDLWFSKVSPSMGTTVTSTVFDIEHAKWQVVETTYLGRKWIAVGGRQVEANEVRDIRDGNVKRVYLDDRGQPILMKNGQMRTEKHF